MKFNQQAAVNEGKEYGLTLVGVIGGNALLKNKLNTLPVTAGAAIGSALVASQIDNPLAKNILRGAAIISGLKALNLMVNGATQSVSGLGDGENPGVKFIPENIKAQLRKILPNLSGEDSPEGYSGGGEPVKIPVEIINGLGEKEIVYADLTGEDDVEGVIAGRRGRKAHRYLPKEVVIPAPSRRTAADQLPCACSVGGVEIPASALV